MGHAYLYGVHVVLQYATYVKNLIVRNSVLRFSEKIRVRPLCTENGVEHTQSSIRIQVLPDIRDSQNVSSTTVLRVCTQVFYV